MNIFNDDFQDFITSLNKFSLPGRCLTDRNYSDYWSVGATRVIGITQTTGVTRSNIVPATKSSNHQVADFCMTIFLILLLIQRGRVQ